MNGREIAMITDVMSQKQNSNFAYRVHISDKGHNLEDKLDFCREKFGHRGNHSGWWWRVQGKWSDRQFVFLFEKEEDALIFKLSKG